MPTILAKWGGWRGTDYAISKAITIPAWKKKDHVCASDSSCFQISFAFREASFMFKFWCFDRFFCINIFIYWPLGSIYNIFMFVLSCVG